MMVKLKYEILKVQKDKYLDAEVKVLSININYNRNGNT